MKKLIALVLALALVLAVAVASANTITVNNALAGETYVAYKMLDLSHQGSDGQGGDPTAYRYTVNSAWTGFFTTTNTVVSAVFSIDSDGYVTSTVPDETAWSATSALSAFAEAAAAYARTNNLTPADTQTVATGETSVNLTTGDGYYLITSTLGTRAMIDTTPGNVTINEKNEGDTVEKTVKEDSTNAYGENNDAQVGDTVEFKSEVTVAPRSINVKIHDKMDAGLTLNPNSIHVYTDAALENEYNDATIVTSGTGLGMYNTTDSDTFTISIPDTFAATATASLKLYVVYTAEVNRAAIVTDTNGTAIVDQYNRTKVTFGNNTSSTEDFTTTTTHKFEVLKYKTGDTSKAHLADAIFEVKKGDAVVKLYKIDANNYRVADDTETGSAATHVADNNEVASISNGTLVSNFVTVASGNIVIWGIDDDTNDVYTLHEVQAPKGYNKVADTTVNFAATVNATVVEVANATGAELPSTGGIGTTIFYILGGLLVVGAAVILVARRKASN